MVLSVFISPLLNSFVGCILLLVSHPPHEIFTSLYFKFINLYDPHCIDEDYVNIP